MLYAVEDVWMCCLYVFIPLAHIRIYLQKENVDEDILVMGKGTNKVEIDLMQPIDPEKAPKVHVPTLNHIGLWVDDLHKCVDELTAKDVRFTPGGIRKGAGELC